MIFFFQGSGISGEILTVSGLETTPYFELPAKGFICDYSNMAMKETALIIIVSLSIVVMVLTDLQLIKTQNSFYSTMQTIKGQLDQSEKGIVNVPEPDYGMATIMSFVSFATGIGVGWLFFRK